MLPVTLPTETDKFSSWLMHRSGPCLVAGPCSVETEEQILGTARELAKNDITLLRGGIWKPRTSPGSFEGIGEKGLSWLRAAGRATGLPVATEVATPAHVERCLIADVDVLWIGARTTTSPIAVQAIADSLAGVDIPVMIKNPMNPELGLWIGAIERIRHAGVKRIVAVHRGFSTHIQHKYRYQPLWRIPLELRRRMPEIPILCDPSHICGARQYVPAVAAEALEVGLDGLMVECHWRPESALSDPGQQLSPGQFAELARNIVSISGSGVGEANEQLCNQWREIDEIDQDLSVLLTKRMSILQQAREDRDGLSGKDLTSVCATRLMAALVKQLPRNIERKSGVCPSGCLETEADSDGARKWQFQSGIDPCGESVSSNRLA